MAHSAPASAGKEPINVHATSDISLFFLMVGVLSILALILVVSIAAGVVGWVWSPGPLVVKIAAAVVGGSMGMVGACLGLFGLCAGGELAWTGAARCLNARPLPERALRDLDDKSLEQLKHVLERCGEGERRPEPHPQGELKLFCARRLLRYNRLNDRPDGYYSVHRQTRALLAVEDARRERKLLAIAAPGRLTRPSSLSD